MKQVYLTLIAVVRDQEHYIKEWLTFYRLIGVERFVLVLHKCQDMTEARIKELPFLNDIHVHHVVDDRTDSVQLGAYHWSVVRYGHFSEWLLFIDTDEFYFGTEEDSLPTILECYEEYGGLAAHQLNFGSNNQVLRPDGLSMEAFTRRRKDDDETNRVVKTAIRTKELVAMLSPHVQVTIAPVVCEHFEPLGDVHWRPYKTASWDIVRCNHYHTRSMQDWVDRRIRGSCNTYHKNNGLYDVSRFIDYNSSEATEDTTILRFAERIKEITQ